MRGEGRSLVNSSAHRVHAASPVKEQLLAAGDGSHLLSLCMLLTFVRLQQLRLGVVMNLYALARAELEHHVPQLGDICQSGFDACARRCTCGGDCLAVSRTGFENICQPVKQALLTMLTTNRWVFR